MEEKNLDFFLINHYKIEFQQSNLSKILNSNKIIRNEIKTSHLNDKNF